MDERKAVSVLMAVYGGQERALSVPVQNVRDAAAVSASIVAFVKGLNRLRRADEREIPKPGKPWWTK